MENATPLPPTLWIAAWMSRGRCGWACYIVHKRPHLWLSYPAYIPPAIHSAPAVARRGAASVSALPAELGGLWHAARAMTIPTIHTPYDDLLRYLSIHLQVKREREIQSGDDSRHQGSNPHDLCTHFSTRAAWTSKRKPRILSPSHQTTIIPHCTARSHAGAYRCGLTRGWLV